MSTFDELVKRARANLIKSAFVPMTGQGPSQPAPGPEAGTGGPPMAPGGGAPPPQDPNAAAGGDPNAAAGGAPGGDPNAAPPGGGGQMQAGMDPSQPVQLTMNDLVQLFQMVAGGGAQPAPQPAGDDKGAGAGGGKDGKGGKGGKANVENELRDIRHSIERLVAAITGDPSAGAAAQQASGPPPPPPAAGGDQLGVGGGDPATMGQGVDPSAAPPTPEIPGQPSMAPPGVPTPGMQVQASAHQKGMGKSAAQLSRIIANLKRT